MTDKLPLADPGIFFTYQGEGHLTGQPMVFIRLAGCSVGCPQCDTNYTFGKESLTPEEITNTAIKYLDEKKITDRWVWITGGEPLDHKIDSLIDTLHNSNLSVALATSGEKRSTKPVDWLSVSPHGGRLLQTFGNELKLIPGLNGLDPFKWIEEHSVNFWLKFIQPLAIAGEVQEDSLQICKDFIEMYPDWCLSWQQHKLWEIE